jgi:hypothetical protein
MGAVCGRSELAVNDRARRGPGNDRNLDLLPDPVYLSTSVPRRPKVRGVMAYKLDGAKFPTIEELVEALYPLYADRMSETDFRKYVEENAERS